MTEHEAMADILYLPHHRLRQSLEAAEDQPVPEAASQQTLSDLYEGVVDILGMPQGPVSAVNAEGWLSGTCPGEEIIQYEVCQHHKNGLAFFERIDRVVMSRAEDGSIVPLYWVNYRRGVWERSTVQDAAGRNYWERIYDDGSGLSLNDEVLTGEVAARHQQELVAEADRRANAMRKKYMLGQKSIYFSW